ARLRSRQQIFTNDDEGHSGWPEVLLGPGVEQTEAADGEGTAEDVRRGIGNERNIGRDGGKCAPLGPLDGVVGGDVQVGGPSRERQLAGCWNTAVPVGLRRAGDGDLAD